MSMQTAPTRPHRLGYRVRELVDMTGLSESTIRRWIASGTLETVHVGRSIFVTPNSVHALFGIDR